MKRFLFTISLILFTSTAFAKSSNIKAEPSKRANSEKEISIDEALNSSANIPDDEKNISDIQKFNFEKIFAEADKYYKAAESWNKLQCVPKSYFICSKKECPKIKMESKTHIILDRKSKMAAICENEICKDFAANFKHSGVFVSVTPEESNSVLIKILGDSKFKQISIVGLDVYIVNGECTRIDN